MFFLIFFFCYFFISFVEFESLRVREERGREREKGVAQNLDLNWLVDMCAAFWDSYITQLRRTDSAAFAAAIVGQCRYVVACYFHD